jgi:hypothetical protein
VLAPNDVQVCPSCGGSLAQAAPKKPSLVVRWGIPAAVGAVLIAAFVFFDVITNPHGVLRNIFRRAEPVYQWVQADDRTFAILPGESKAWGPFEPQQGKIRYVISAYLPVDTGLMEESQWENTDAAMKKTSACYQSKIKGSDKTCAVATGKPQLIFVRDVRPKQIPLGGTPTDFAGKKTLQDQNSVTITVFAWKCMEHCR